jgi:hypothetical protein
MMRGNNYEGKMDYLTLVITGHRDFMGRLKRRSPLGRPRRIQEDGI